MGTKHTGNISSLGHEEVSTSSVSPSLEGKIPASVENLFKNVRNSTAAVAVAAALTACGGGGGGDEGPSHEVPSAPAPAPEPAPAPAPTPNLPPPPLEVPPTAVREGVVGKTPVQIEDILRKAGFDQRITDILANSKNPNVQCQTHKDANGSPVLTIRVQEGIQTEEVATCELKGSGKYIAPSSSQSRLEPNDQYGTISQTVEYSTFADTKAPEITTKTQTYVAEAGIDGSIDLGKFLKTQDGSVKHGFDISYTVNAEKLPYGFSLEKNKDGQTVLKWTRASYAKQYTIPLIVSDAAGNRTETKVLVELESYTPEPITPAPAPAPTPTPPPPAPAPSCPGDTDWDPRRWICI